MDTPWFMYESILHASLSKSWPCEYLFWLHFFIQYIHFYTNKKTVSAILFVAALHTANYCIFRMFCQRIDNNNSVTLFTRMNAAWKKEKSMHIGWNMLTSFIWFTKNGREKCTFTFFISFIWMIYETKWKKNRLWLNVSYRMWMRQPLASSDESAMECIMLCSDYVSNESPLIMLNMSVRCTHFAHGLEWLQTTSWTTTRISPQKHSNDSTNRGCGFIAVSK